LTIVSRGAAGGYTRLLPEEDRGLWSKNQFEAMLAVMMGGQAAEEIVFGDITTGASNDLQNANGVARKMVTEYGMSREIGPRTYESGSESVFLGRDLGQGQTISDSLAEKIDSEISKLLHLGQSTAKSIIEANRARLNRLASRLLVVETLEGPELHQLLTGSTEDGPIAA
jgi:cell division protease FtsH